MGTAHSADAADLDEEDGIDFLDLMVSFAERWKLLVFGPLVASALAVASTYLVPPTYTATTSFIPPLQQQSAAAAALASLGGLANVAGAATGLKSPADQYVALLQSVTVADRLIDQFKLLDVYKVDYRFEARKALARNVRVSLGRKDGLISLQVEDKDPQRAADLANRHVDELRRLSGELALTEAQQRRAFFETQLAQTRSNLTKAQRALEESGFSSGALRADPRAAAEAYARMRAEVTAAEVRLQTLRRSFADGTPEVRQQQTLLQALRGQLAKLESTSDADSQPGDYVGRYREFKYQETLFDLFVRQYELARLDESREGALVQVIDVARRPEWKSGPSRAKAAAISGAASFLALVLFVLVRRSWHRWMRDPRAAERLLRLRGAFLKARP